MNTLICSLSRENFLNDMNLCLSCVRNICSDKTLCLRVRRSKKQPFRHFWSETACLAVIGSEKAPFFRHFCLNCLEKSVCFFNWKWPHRKNTGPVRQKTEIFASGKHMAIPQHFKLRSTFKIEKFIDGVRTLTCQEQILSMTVLNFAGAFGKAWKV